MASKQMRNVAVYLFVQVLLWCVRLIFTVALVGDFVATHAVWVSPRNRQEVTKKALAGVSADDHMPPKTATRFYDTTLTAGCAAIKTFLLRLAGRKETVPKVFRDWATVNVCDPSPRHHCVFAHVRNGRHDSRSHGCRLL